MFDWVLNTHLLFLFVQTGLLQGGSKVTYNSSGEYVTSSEFESVHKSSFSDERELKMRALNSFRGW